MRKDGKDHEAGLHDQTNLLPKRELITVFCIMALSLCVCFIDQNGIGVLLPSIAKDLHAQSTIAWAGTSALIANTVFQVLYGRLSDLFGRKIVLLSALVLLALSDLIVGLAPNAVVLYVFRGLAGVANGGITSLTMMIVSDVVTLQQRGRYQGILGAFFGIGNAVGPLIAAGFAEHTTWRGLFYLLAPLALCAAVASWKVLPSNMPKTNFSETVRMVDFGGLVFGTLAIILILIPVSEGGHGLAWSSPTIITMLAIGGVCSILFILVEWRFAKLPMMPRKIAPRPSTSLAQRPANADCCCLRCSWHVSLPLSGGNALAKLSPRCKLLHVLVLPPAVLSKCARLLDLDLSTSPSPARHRSIHLLRPRRPVPISHESLRRSHLRRLRPLDAWLRPADPLQPHHTPSDHLRLLSLNRH